jgi:hypothetical protein
MSRRLVFAQLVSGMLVAASLLALASPSARVYGQEPTPLDAPKWDVGDQWTWQHGTDRITWTVQAAGGGYTVQAKSALATRMIHIGLDFSSTDLQHILLHDMSLQFPLTVGKEWRYSITGNNPQTGTPLSWSIQRRVEKIESITVPAGTFDSVRIAGHQCVAVAPNTGTYPYVAVSPCADFVTWYAPKVKQVVEIIRIGAASYWGELAGSQILVAYDLHNR